MIRRETTTGHGQSDRARYLEKIRDRSRMPLLIKTLEGTVRAELGDWIVSGIQGEYYPVRADIFTATYTPVAETPFDPEDDADAE